MYVVRRMPEKKKVDPSHSTSIEASTPVVVDKHRTASIPRGLADVLLVASVVLCFMDMREPSTQDQTHATHFYLPPATFSWDL